MRTMAKTRTTVWTLAGRYSARIRAILRKIAEALRSEGFEVEGPYYLGRQGNENPRWYLSVPPDEEGGESVDISLDIAESERFDGTEGGVNFTIDIVEEGGRVLGGMAPYNYTDDVWVQRSDAKAVEARFALIEESARSHAEIVRIVKEADRG